MHAQLHSAVETFGTPGTGPFFITCEHASNRVPAPGRSSAADRHWLQTHWGLDIGGAALTRSLSRTTGSAAALARFSRLVCDPNRPPDHPDLIRTEVEGHALSFNQGLTEAERARRLAEWHAPYHDAVHAGVAAAVARRPDTLLLSIHTFTPVWANRLRTMDIGVLFSTEEELALRFARLLRRQGYDTALNEPYSGRDGLIYGAARHGLHHGIPFLELEVNQALTSTPARARKVARRVAGALAALWPGQTPR